MLSHINLSLSLTWKSMSWKIMMQEPLNSWTEDALARTAYEPRSKNFPDFLYFVRHWKFCSMTSPVNLFWTCNLISVTKTRNTRPPNSFWSIIMIKKLYLKNAKLSGLLTFKSRPLWCTLSDGSWTIKFNFLKLLHREHYCLDSFM